MNIEAIMEGWLLADDRYPPFRKDDLVKLAFSIEETELKESDSDTLYFRQIKGAAFYEFNARAIEIYPSTDSITLIAFDAGNFKFYIAPYITDDFKKDKIYTGKGTLLVDYFFWAENSKYHKYLPNLYHKFRIRKIESITIPESSKIKTDEMEVFKTKLPPEKSAKAVRKEIPIARGDKDVCGRYFVLSMTNEGLEHERIPRSYGRHILGKEIAVVGKTGQLEITVQAGDEPPHFHVTKKGCYDVKITMKDWKVLGYEQQINNAEISDDEIKKLKRWSSRKRSGTQFNNSSLFYMYWTALNSEDGIINSI